MASAHPLIDLFRSPAVNRISEFASVAASIGTADIAAQYSVEVANAPKRHSRGKMYFSNGHTGHPSSGSFSNRSEEHLAIALWNSFRTSGISLPNGDEMVFIDYQVPLKASRLDSSIGKMDLFGIVGSSSSCSGRICELKRLSDDGKKRGADTPLKALLECLAYRAMAEANLSDLSAELGKSCQDLECVVLAPIEYWDWFASKASAGNWVAQMKSLLKRIEGDLGFKCSLLALDNCRWTMGCNGDAPVLSCLPAVREALKPEQQVSGRSNNFKIREQKRQAEFRAASLTITDEGRRPIDDPGRRVPYLLALGHEEENLVPELRGSGGAIDFFRQRDIHWWKKEETGDDLNRGVPTRNMLSSQVACVNVLMSLAADKEALLILLRSVDPEVTDIVPIASAGSNAFVEFEWCGKAPIEGGPPHRGEYVTNADALMIGLVGQLRRAYLWEWKYIESYEGGVSLSIGRSGSRRLQTYGPLYETSSSFNNKEIPLREFFYDPFYQLMRLRLLADRMVSSSELNVSSAKLLLVCPEENVAYLETITSPEFLARFPNGQTICEVFSNTMRDSNGFIWTSPRKILTSLRENCSPRLARQAEYLRGRYAW